jgi:hypothetical protein
MFARTSFADHAVAHFADTLRKAERYADAIKVLRMWLDALPINKRCNADLHKVEKLVEAAPLGFAQAMLPWFVETATASVNQVASFRLRFPSSDSLPYDWDYSHRNGTIIQSLRTALSLAAGLYPNDIAALIKPLQEVEVEEVQQLIAETYVAAGEALASDAYPFIMSDPRRFCVGDAHVEMRPSCLSSISGLVSQDLVAAIVPALSYDELRNLCDAIESWSLYTTGAFQAADADLRRKRIQWADEHRMPLLEKLPLHVLAPRRLRQVKEWRTDNPAPFRRYGRGSMLSSVGSPMRAEEMLKANDNAIVGILNEINDAHERDSWRRMPSRNGGVRELARAFADFGKAQPTRAIAIARERLAAGVHENAAGYLVEALAATDDVPTEEIIALIVSLSQRGFSSYGWHQSAARAFSSIARRAAGLSDNLIDMLEGWLEFDADAIAEQISRRLGFEALNRKEEKKAEESQQASPVLFGGHGGSVLVPQHNYTYLSAMAVGFIARAEPDHDSWLSVLERHLTRPEDPEIWSTLIRHKGEWLHWADRKRVQALFLALWNKQPSALSDVSLIGFYWSNQALVPDQVIHEIMSEWLSSDNIRGQQAAAEFITALRIVEPEHSICSQYWAGLDFRTPVEILGSVFSAAAAWRETDASLRERSHPLLMSITPIASGDLAYAISQAVGYRASLVADEKTKELLLAIASNPELLAAATKSRLIDGLDQLLTYPGFDEIVLTIVEGATNLIVEAESYRAEDLVHLAIALQRGNEAVRSRAMDVYERLLDANVYGAEAAARAAAGR